MNSAMQANLAMMYGPDCCSTQEKREVAGKVLVARSRRKL